MELVENRLNMTAQLGGRAVVIHIPKLSPDAEALLQLDPLRRSIDALVPTIQQLDVRLALENMADDDFRARSTLLTEYGSDILGLCYDSGHGNMGQRLGLDHLEPLKHRLIAVHLHDNDGTRDQHWVPFTGTVDFPRLTRLLAASSYSGCISMESNLRQTPDSAKPTFLSDAYRAGERLTEMLAASSKAIK